MTRVGLITLNSSDDPLANLAITQRYVTEAAEAGAQIVLTPEVTNCVSSSRTHQREVLRAESEDPTLAGLQETAKSCGIWLLIGSLALKTDDPDGRFANRSFLITPEGEIAARYDKIHMFDVDVSETETYRESAGYRPGNRAVLAKTALGQIGMAICYDLRFPHLFRSLAQAGADILTVPAAFSAVTGAAHWESLLRARAIETGCFVFAPAQTGQHVETTGSTRRTYGHSLAVSPWGEVLYDGGVEPGWDVIDIDMGDVAHARSRIPSLSHDRDFEVPQ
ncbi:MULTISPECIES: carbon-nitrogen hydrolase family protein [Roseobacteraceae]|uniref:Nitrilase/cyanide hydratase and apolipoprotein N-acyltransferase n=1 Tax=Celeribacter baekdonensis B30 TaxID=1208323 RepID=K2KAU6_9RHOB|nr:MULTISPECIES: carbon-nitrogen hydrolase family protein [Roseobacteraceae]EKE74500.1 Nitrilase/cyanide hydratase and apolipoprotein N-acyltransferase [Celeribacter baekdonensis B30]KAB6716562.1 carbon-nitrogen hydrolase family protein [Roseobacter sp. TSBP12]|tara:strand:- start:8465 stop:9301 length:837 start_codon:yes stop_codon:yes gene_type:complete